MSHRQQYVDLFSASGGNTTPLWRPRLFLLVTLLFLSGAKNFQAYAQPSKTIVTLNELTSVTAEQAGEGLPIKIKGTVLCYDEGWHQLYLNDGQQTVYFNADDFPTSLEKGNVIEITGKARGSNSFINLHAAKLGDAPLPPARKMELSELGNNHGEWIETTGRVLSAETSRGRLALFLQGKNQNCLAYVLGSPVTNDFKHLLDCKVQLRGINASKMEGGVIDPALIFVPGFDEIKIIEPAGTKSLPTAVVSISSLLNAEPDAASNHWVHINGLATTYQPGKSMVIKDATGTIRAKVMQLTEIRQDERVDVWGFLNLARDEAFLDNAYFEVVRPPAIDLRSSSEIASTSRNGNAPAVLESIKSILKLRREEAARHIPVRLRGVVTYADPEWRNCFIQDKGDAVYVDLDPSQKHVQSGQMVELVGKTSPGGFAPEVLSSSLQILCTTNLPAAAHVDLEDLANGHLDANWVEMEGVVRRVDEQSGHIFLSLVTPKGKFSVIIPNPENTPLPEHLIDALVSVQGACTSELNVRRQLSGITLHVPSLEQVKIFEAPASDPFAISATRIDAVATFDPDRLTGRRVKIHGVVTLRIAGQGFIIQDNSGGMRILTRQKNDVNLGDVVDVLGFPAIGDFSPYLEEAMFRRSGTATLPESKKTTAEQILLHGTDDAQVVEIKARLLQSVPRSANPQLVLQDGSIIFTSHLENQNRRAEIQALQSGCLLRLTGVCSIQGNDRHEPQSFRLLLREPGDIELLERAPWWTPMRTFLFAGGMMLTVAATLAWVVLLRRQVNTQTSLIRQKLEEKAALEQRYRDLFENANDIVYTHDLEGKITSINQSGERMLQRSREEILNRNIVSLVVNEQQEAARQWLESVVKGVATPMVEWDFLSASGQRIKVEISTRPIEQDNRLVEVEGIARDITERKRLENEILEISNREQRRIGHDLHDGVCQQLAGIAFMTSALADELEEKGSGESTQAEHISTLINGVIDQTRGVARGLFPVRLEENGLVSALEEFAVNAGDMFKVDCVFVSDNPPLNVENGTAQHLYYIVMEAVANAVKHGRAKKVVIGLEEAGDRYLLRVQDNGIGFTNRGEKQTGMGLRIMHYRARVIGATLTLKSRSGSGTEVCCLFSIVSPEWQANPETNAGRDSASTTRNAI